MKKVVTFLLLLLWLVIIFMLSNQSGQVSGNNSGGIIKMVLEFLYNIGRLPKDNLEIVLDSIHNPIRECAHAFEYFILGFLTLKNIKVFTIKENPYIITIFFCFVCAAFDEIHQLFIIGRAFQYFDLFMDMIGVILILLIFHIKEEKG